MSMNETTTTKMPNICHVHTCVLVLREHLVVVDHVLKFLGRISVQNCDHAKTKQKIKTKNIEILKMHRFV